MPTEAPETLMPEVHELFISRRFKGGGDEESIDIHFLILDAADETIAAAALLATAPPAWYGLGRGEYSAEPISLNTWKAIVNYTSSEEESGSSTYEFEIAADTVHVSHSLETVGRYAPPGKTAPDCNRAIGVNGESVDGCDVYVPTYAFSETHSVPAELITPAYKAALFSLAGKMNGSAFKGFQAGEVLFLGATGSVKSGEPKSDITFRFIASQNVEGMSIGDIVGIDKKGWDYLWVRFEEDLNEAQLVKRPAFVYVERVCPFGDFSLLGI